MSFVRQFGAAAVLVVLTVLFQSAGMAALIYWVRARVARDVHQLEPWHIGELMMQITLLIICLHMLEILLWAGFYRWLCFPSWGMCIYFSTSSYSSLGYGDVVLPRMWRNVGSVESITGVLMCGVSASFLFAIVNRLFDRMPQNPPESAEPRVPVNAPKSDS